MELFIKGILKKASINDSEVNIGKQKISTEEIIEVKYQMPTMAMQGFLTFCTQIEGQHVKSLNDVSLDRNSIMFYKKQNEVAKDILEFFANRGISLTNIAQEQKEEVINNINQKITDRKNFEEESKEFEKKDVLYCSKCHSQQVTYQDKKLSVGRAVVGGVALGGVGAILGGLTGKKGRLKCMKCGNTWKI